MTGLKTIYDCTFIYIHFQTVFFLISNMMPHKGSLRIKKASSINLLNTLMFLMLRSNIFRQFYELDFQFQNFICKLMRSRSAALDVIAGDCVPCIFLLTQQYWRWNSRRAVYAGKNVQCSEIENYTSKCSLRFYTNYVYWV